MTQRTAAEREANAEIAERIFLDSVNRVETDVEMVERICADVIEEMDKPGFSRIMRNLRFLSTDANSYTLLRAHAKLGAPTMDKLRLGMAEVLTDAERRAVMAEMMDDL